MVPSIRTNLFVSFAVFLLCVKDAFSNANDTEENQNDDMNNNNNKEYLLSTNERHRRLIPYTTFYANQNYENNPYAENNDDTSGGIQTPPQRQEYQLPLIKHQERPNYLYNYQNIPMTKYRYIASPYFIGNQNPRYYESPQHVQLDAPIGVNTKTTKFSPSIVLQENLYSTPQPDYLKFRYANIHKSRTPIFTTVRPITAEISSSIQNYITTAEPTISSLPMYKSHEMLGQESIGSSTSTSATPEYNYRKPVSILQYLPSSLPKNNYLPITKYAKNTLPERATKKTLTTMTIMKSHEIEIDHHQMNKQPNTVYQQPKQQIYVQQYVTKAQQPPPVNILNGYELNKQLPERITPDNIKESIRTLSYILHLLQKADSIAQSHQPTYSNSVLQTYKLPTLSLDDDVNNPISPENSFNYNRNEYNNEHRNYPHTQSIPQPYTIQPIKDDEGTPGKAGLDYPIYSIVPQTQFNCKEQRYKGFFADQETNCQVWHYCDLNGGQASFLCPNGTIFSQAALTCDWWFNVKCSSTPQLYVLNERLYKYILPVRPSFPEDFSGPLVDQYLTEKFKETESKRKYRIPNNSTASIEHATNANNTLMDFESSS